MKNLPRQLTVFLPCASLENFSIRRSTSEAEEIFAGWAAAFHPTFLTTFELLPIWNSADYPPNLKNPGIAYLPPSAEQTIPTQWQNQQDDPNAPFQLVRGVSDRQEIARRIAALAEVELPVETPPALTAFEALGIASFLVELLGRQYRYMSSIHTDRFRTAVQAAAVASLKGELNELENQLQNAFDRLLEARETFFPSGVHFIDLLLTDSKHIGRAFREEIERMESEMTLAKPIKPRETVNRPNAEWTMEPEAAAVLLPSANEKTIDNATTTDDAATIGEEKTSRESTETEPPENNIPENTSENSENMSENVSENDVSEGDTSEKDTSEDNTFNQTIAAADGAVSETATNASASEVAASVVSDTSEGGKPSNADKKSSDEASHATETFCDESTDDGDDDEEEEAVLRLPTPQNLWITGRTLEQLAEKDSTLIETMRRLLTNKELAVIGGLYEEHATSLLAPEDVADNLMRGVTTAKRILARRPEVFGSRRFGLTATLPQILKQFGFMGAMHMAFDEGVYPDYRQSRMRWRGVGMGAIESLCTLPSTPRESERWLRIPEMIGTPYGPDSTPTFTVARWANQSGWLPDIFRTISRYAPVLGEYRTLTSYFTKTFSASRLKQYEASSYRSPYLLQMIEAKESDPISRWVRHHRRRALATAIRSLESLYRTLVAVVKPMSPATDFHYAKVEKNVPSNRLSSDTIHRELELIASELDTLTATLLPTLGAYQTEERAIQTRQTEADQLERMRRLLAKLLTLLAQKLTNMTVKVEKSSVSMDGVASESSSKDSQTSDSLHLGNDAMDVSSPLRGILCVNPWNRAIYRAYEMDPSKKKFPRIQNVSVDGWGFRWLPTSEHTSTLPLESRSESVVPKNSIPAAASQNSLATTDSTDSMDSTDAVSNDPTASTTATSKASRMSAPVQLQYDESEKLYTLQNGWMQVTLDRTTGAIRSIQNHGFRRNRLALQWAMHQCDEAMGLNSQDMPGCAKEYSLCAADSITVEEQTVERIVLRIRGRLVHRDGTQLSDYTAVLHLRRGSPLLECELLLNPHVLPEDTERNPWKSAYVLRLAWADDAAIVSYGAHLFHVESPTCEVGSIRTIESPYFVDVQNLNTQYTLLCGGLPFHRRYGPRRLDTLLITAGETERRFRFAIGVDLVQPVPAAMDFLTATESFAVYDQPAPVMTDAWWYHLDAKNLMVTLFEPIYADSEGKTIPKTWTAPRDDSSQKQNTVVGVTANVTQNVRNVPSDTAEKEEKSFTGNSDGNVEAGDAVRRVVGARMRIMETEGHEVRTTLTTYRRIVEAAATDFLGENRRMLSVDGDEVTIDFDPHQWRQIEICWIK